MVIDRSTNLDYFPDAPDSANASCILVATPQPLQMAIAESRWSTRGWAMQEKLLSRRCLYFSHDAVYFQYAKAGELQKPDPTSARPEARDKAGGGVVITVDPKTSRLWVISGPPPRDPNSLKERRTPPNILPFKGLSVPLRSYQITTKKQYLSTQQRVYQIRPQSVRDIVTKSGKHCGLWWEQTGYGYMGLGIDAAVDSNFIMVEISRWGDAYRPREGPYRVEGEVPFFYDEAFPSIGSCSGLVNVLVVDLDTDHAGGMGDRCTVAVIQRAACEAAGPVEREVQIANEER
ncbi:HET-domain-containing protein [Paramyrothecium foliicola]|nr:HET-domain-containing protein [Paramyrothecium foliicola]